MTAATHAPGPAEPEERVEVTVHGSLREIAAADWDACACPRDAPGSAPGGAPGSAPVATGRRPLDPFTTHRFLLALEESRSVGGRTGWEPRHLAVRRAGEVVAVAPLYAKSHSQGEYIFDWGWAEAWERAGGRYYPKLQAAVPFTPVTGRRLLCRPGFEALGRAALVEAMVRLASRSGASSVHVTFCTAEEALAGEAMGLLHRHSRQFHWRDEGFGDFDGFLAALSSRKRKTIRAERAAAQGFGGTIESVTGADLTPAHWDALWAFYQDTGRRKWGHPYLTRAFFDLAAERLADDVLMIAARRGPRLVAGAMNLIGRDALFGRYWGSVEAIPFLHFELCYYRAIDWALAHGLARVEAGAQGEHKVARGYRPVVTHSLHWIADPAFRRAVADFLARERAAVDEEVEVLTAYGPFRRGPRPEAGPEQD